MLKYNHAHPLLSLLNLKLPNTPQRPFMDTLDQDQTAQNIAVGIRI